MRHRTIRTIETIRTIGSIGTIGTIGSAIALAFLAVCGIGGCDSKAPELVVYTALDRQFSEPIFAEFTKRTGIRVRAAYDTEAQKTVGLANRIRFEKSRPRCDVFWNNEILNTILLKDEGLLVASKPAEAANLPARYRDPDGVWYGFAARARVLIVNTDIVHEGERPARVADLADPKWRGRVAIAKPLFGTTASHAACLFATLGDEEAIALFERIRANDPQLHAGNKGCAVAVGNGDAAFALTDTDDAIAELDAGKPVAIVYPDSAAGEAGTLLLPNAVAVVGGCDDVENAARLIDFLLSPEVEAMLARGHSAQIPLNAKTTERSRLGNLDALRPMEIDFARAASAFARAREYVEQRFLR